MSKYSFIQKSLWLVGLLWIHIHAFAIDFESGDFLYSISKNGLSCSVSGVANSFIEQAAIPAKVSYAGKTYPVTSIGDEAFEGCITLRNVEIPSSVTSIGAHAFNSCESLSSVDIPSSVTSIGYAAFYECTFLRSVEIPSSVTSIGGATFSYCTSLSSVNIPSSVTSIGEYAFMDCTSLSSVNIPSSVTSIGYAAFKDCASLSSVNIPSSVTSIGMNAFKGCTSLREIVCHAYVPPVWDQSFYSNMRKCRLVVPQASLGNYRKTKPWKYFLFTFEFAVDNLIYEMGEDGLSCFVSGFSSSFNGRAKIPENVSYEGRFYPVKGIREYAFYNCRSLRGVEIPSSVTSIGESAFRDCAFLSSVEIPSSVTSIGESAFRNCASLSSVEIPSSVTSIGESAFAGCTSLSSVEIPSSVTSIGESAFKDCASLSSVEILSSVTNIEAYTFAYCTSLSSVEISSSVTSIGDDAFYGCTSLREIICHALVPPVCAYFSIFEGVDLEKCRLFVPGGSLAKYRTASVWRDFFEFTSDIFFYELNEDGLSFSISCIGSRRIEQAEIPASVSYKGKVYPVTAIGDSAFYNYGSLKSIEIPSSVTSIGESAFEDCSSLSSVEIPSSVTSIGAYAFDWCFSLSSVDIPSSVTSIGASAFRDCSSLSSVEIPSSVTSIGASAFLGCSSLSSVDIPSSVTSIGASAFLWCKSLSSVEIPSSVTSIGNDAFCGCTSLREIVCHADVPPVCASFSIFEGVDLEKCRLFVPGGSLAEYKIAWGDFFEFTSDIFFYGLNEDGLPFSISCIGSRQIEQAEIPASVPYKGKVYPVTSIGASAFWECSSLSSVDIPSSVTSIGESAFAGCTSLSSVDIPSSVTSIGEFTFLGCSSLSSVEIPSSVTSIGEYTFAGCSSLSSVEIPSSVTSIGSGAFYVCTSLREIICHALVPPVCVSYLGFMQFEGVDLEKCRLIVPGVSIADYRVTYPWNDFFLISAVGLDKVVADEGDFRVVVIDGKIVVEGCDGFPAIEVYDQGGSLVYKGRDMEIPVGHRGTYLVKIEDVIRKVIL